jgi:hypothetical protein
MFPREDARPGECSVVPASSSIASLVSSIQNIKTSRMACCLGRMPAQGSVRLSLHQVASLVSSARSIHSIKDTRIACFPARMPARGSVRLCLHPVASLVSSVVSTVSKRRAWHVSPRGCLPRECPVVPTSTSIASLVSSIHSMKAAHDAHGMFPRADACPGECLVVPASSSIASIVSSILRIKKTRMACFPARMPAQGSVRLCLHPVASRVSLVLSTVSKRRAWHVAPGGCLPRGVFGCVCIQ